jgi:hypothetical protein
LLRKGITNVDVIQTNGMVQREEQRGWGASGADEKSAGPGQGIGFGCSRENETGRFSALACEKLIRCYYYMITSWQAAGSEVRSGILRHYARAAFGPLRGMGVLVPERRNFGGLELGDEVTG